MNANEDERQALSVLSEFAQSVAIQLPAGLPPFEVTGTDPISLAIASKMREVEGGLHDDLLALKADMTALAFEIQDEAAR